MSNHSRHLAEDSGVVWLDVQGICYRVV